VLRSLINCAVLSDIFWGRAIFRQYAPKINRHKGSNTTRIKYTREAKYVQRDTEARSLSNCCRGKATCITYSQRVFVALVIQHAAHMRRILLSSVACPAVLYFSTLSYKGHDFRKKKSLNTKYEFRFSLQLLHKTFLILRSTERHMIINVHTPSCKVPVIFV